MFDAVAEAVRAASREQVLCLALDDVHAADRSSLALLAHVLGAAPNARLLVVLTYRSAEVGPGHPLAAVLDALERDRRLTRVELHGLPEASIERFLPPRTEIAPATVRALHERTAGNPFFLRELVRMLAERGELAGDDAELPALVPDRVREVVGRRLEPLDPATREVLAIAGVVGRPFTIAGVARVGGLGRESVAVALEPALAGRLVEPRADAPGRFGFAHAIVRDAVYDELTPGAARPAPRRRRQPAAGVARRGRRGDRRRGRPPCARRRALRRRPRSRPGRCRSRRRARRPRCRRTPRPPRTTAARSRRSSSARRSSPAERLDATLALAAATFAAGDIEAARRRFAAVAGAARRTGAAELQARAAIGFSEVQPYGVIDEEAIALLQGALDALPPDDSALRARAAALLGPAARSRHRPVAARGAPRRGHRDGPPARRRRRAARPAVRRRAGQLAARARRGPRGGDRARCSGSPRAAPTSPRVFWARTLRLRDALEAGDARRGRRRARAARAARGREPARVLPLVPARPPGGARDLRRPPRGGRAARRRGGGAQPPPRRRRRPGAHRVQRLALALQRRRPADAPLAALREYAPPATPRSRCGRRCSPRSSAGIGGEGGRRAVGALARDGFAALLRTPDWLCGLVLLAEPVAACGDAGAGDGADGRARADHADRNAVMDAAWAAFGPVARPLGVLAAAAGRPEEAAAHFAARGRAGRALGRARLGARRARRLAAQAAPGRRSCTGARAALGAARAAARAAQTTTP